MSQPIIPTDVRERVIAAANELYQQSNRERFPTVDAVRRQSRADMNTVSMLMKEWRQAQTTQAVAVAVAVPEAVQQASSSALAAIWQQATELANQSLRSAQAGWEAERQEMDEMRAELSAGYEAQVAELDLTKGRLADVLSKFEAEQIFHASEISRFEKSAAELKDQLAAATERAHTAEARTIEIERRADDLKTMLDASQESIKVATARADAAREESARLQGHTEALKAQAADLMRALADKQASVKSAKGG